MKIKIPRKQKKKLKNLQPLVFVFYINVGNLDNHHVAEYMEKIFNVLKNSENNFVNYFIPVRDQETKVECINPVQVNKKVYSKVIQQLEEYNTKLNNFIEEINK
jgi:hypothetical protein